MKKKLSIVLVIVQSLCLAYIFYLTYLYAKPNYSLLVEYLKAKERGETLILIGNEISVYGMILYLLTRVIMIFSGLYLFIKKSTFALLFFAAAWLPFVFDFINFSVTESGQYFKAIGWKDTVSLVHRELLCTVFILAIIFFELILNRTVLKDLRKKRLLFFFLIMLTTMTCLYFLFRPTVC
jgi:hypothetical protein